MIVIGLGHRARSGKDTVASHLVQHYGFKRYALADILKESVNIVTGWNEDHSFGHLKEVPDPTWGCSPRYAYQKLGTEGYRKLLGEDVWAKALRIRMEKDAAASHDPGGFRAVIADVRFKAGEVDMVKALGGFLWRVDRPGLPALTVPPKSQLIQRWSRFTGKDKHWSHQSEWDLVDFNQWDAIIDNSGSLEELYAKVDSLVMEVV